MEVAGTPNSGLEWSRGYDTSVGYDIEDPTEVKSGDDLFESEPEPDGLDFEKGNTEKCTQSQMSPSWEHTIWF
jgi:hypothetical protein